MSRQLIEATGDYGFAMSFALFLSMEKLGEHDCAHDIRLRLEWWHRMLAIAAVAALRASQDGA